MSSPTAVNMAIAARIEQIQRTIQRVEFELLQATVALQASNDAAMREKVAMASMVQDLNKNISKPLGTARATTSVVS